MAGHGPAPAEKRRRSNDPARGDWVELEPLKRAALPPLPRGDDWSATTRTAWAAWRADPVTALYSPADIAFALDTIRLHEGMTAWSASEVRLRMDSLGLTPKGKRDLRWRIATPEASAAAPAKPRKSGARRARLSVVK